MNLKIRGVYMTVTLKNQITRYASIAYERFGCINLEQQVQDAIDAMRYYDIDTVVVDNNTIDAYKIPVALESSLELEQTRKFVNGKWYLASTYNTVYLIVNETVALFAIEPCEQLVPYEWDGETIYNPMGLSEINLNTLTGKYRITQA